MEMQPVEDDADLPSPMAGPRLAGGRPTSPPLGQPGGRALRMTTAGELSGSYQPALARTLTSKMSSLANLFPEDSPSPRGDRAST